MTDSHPEHRRVKGKNITRIMPFLYKVRLAMTTTLTGAGPGGGRGKRPDHIGSHEDRITELESGQATTPKGLRDGGHGGPPGIRSPWWRDAPHPLKLAPRQPHGNLIKPPGPATNLQEV